MPGGGCSALNIGTHLLAVIRKRLTKLFVEAPFWAALVIFTQVSARIVGGCGRVASL